ncbi:MAG: hypothetical protein AAGC55_11255, partial [Myxococcota bacterium]
MNLPGGLALLVAGHAAARPDDARQAANGPQRKAVTAAMGRLGELLMAAEPPWQVRRMMPDDSHDRRPDNVPIKQQIDRIAASDADAVAVVLSCATIARSGETNVIT